ncbi:MAG: glycosyltransferase family 4 protein [Deltaproteobacteria bacterium]|nr:glycosyltransferase family 4 protein [Deltaproteobacteria bacterium]
MVSVIYNGIDFNKFNTRPMNDGRPVTVGLVANLNRKVKKVDIFLRAAALVAETRNDVKFYIIGDGILKNELMNLSKKLGLNNQVVFTGRSRNIEKDLKLIDIGVNTSETEGFSNVILEYLASGIPVVATDVGGNREIIVEGQNGYLFSVNDNRALAQKLDLILDDPAIYARLRDKCRRSLRGRFENSVMVKHYETFFRNIVKAKRR